MNITNYIYIYKYICAFSSLISAYTSISVKDGSHRSCEFQMNQFMSNEISITTKNHSQIRIKISLMLERNFSKNIMLFMMYKFLRRMY